MIEVPILATVRHGGRSTTGYRSALRMYVGAYRLWQRERSRGGGAGADAADLWEQHDREWRDPAQVASGRRDASRVDPELLRLRARGAFWELLDELGIACSWRASTSTCSSRLTVGGRPPAGLVPAAAASVGHRRRPDAGQRRRLRREHAQPEPGLRVPRLRGPAPRRAARSFAAARPASYPGACTSTTSRSSAARCTRTRSAQNAVVRLDGRRRLRARLVAAVHRARRRAGLPAQPPPAELDRRGRRRSRARSSPRRRTSSSRRRPGHWTSRSTAAA